MSRWIISVTFVEESRLSAAYGASSERKFMKKQIELTIEDFQAHPIWKTLDPAGDVVKPWPKKGDAPLFSLVST